MGFFLLVFMLIKKCFIGIKNGYCLSRLSWEYKYKNLNKVIWSNNIKKEESIKLKIICTLWKNKGKIVNDVVSLGKRILNSEYVYNCYTINMKLGLGIENKISFLISIAF